MSKIDRRSFIRTGINTGLTLGSLSLVPRLLFASVKLPGQLPDISVTSGTDYFAGTVKAIEQLGGIERFIARGDKVGLLANSGYKKPGTFTRPDVVLAVAFLCLEAGAKDVYLLRGEEEDYWRRSPLYENHRKLIARLKADESDHQPVDIQEGKILKEAKVRGGFLDYDKVINIPIVKNHGEIRMTATLKNTMGINAFSSNIKFHTGPNLISGAVKTLLDNYHNMEYLAQCIADLNLVRRFDLYVADVTEFITTNGPSGPGNLKKLNKVVAGTDRIAVDAFCCQFLGLDPATEPLIIKAFENKLGEIDLSNITVKES